MTIRRYLACLAAAGGLLVAGTATASGQLTPEAARPVVTAPAGGPGDFAAAAREFQVPEALLLAYSFALTRWDDHAGAPSAMGGYGPLHLTAPAAVRFSADRGAGHLERTARLRTDPAHNTLARAATLLGQPAEALRGDVRLNIRGGAALLADEARRADRWPAKLADWYPVLMRLSGGSGSTVLADDVYETLSRGVERTTSAGHRLRLAAHPDARHAGERRDRKQRTGAQVADQRIECPAEVTCRFVPAAYEWVDTADANDYGNYDPANRPADGNKIKYIIIHNTQGSYNSTVATFQNPRSYKSTHYVIRSSDGAVTQMLATKDIGWHSGNWNMNTESIGIEHEGWAEDGATWYTEAMYRSSAALVRYLAQRYGIPLDRQHILGHDDIANESNYRNSHWDPGPFWDWDRYLTLLGAGPVTPDAEPAQPASEPARPGGEPARPGGELVTISPKFTENQYPLRYCPPGALPCRDVPAQPSNFLFLRTEPRDDAPLLTDPIIGGGTTDVADWTDKAVTGRRYAVAERRADWTAIWYGGQRAWLRTAGTTPATGTTVRPRPGAAIDVFDGARPQPHEWPPGTPAGKPNPVAGPKPLYKISGDQLYPMLDEQPARYFYSRFEGANVPHDDTMVRGRELYYRISFHHRDMYVRASDVMLS